ncbi:unnamed protein product [Linum trigynum]|uniref:Uncharacterized protein n=1 Tax=Linum trigynum TaxID=586398 RepID=A0AAV2FPS5_9ROSI
MGAIPGAHSFFPHHGFGKEQLGDIFGKFLDLNTMGMLNQPVEGDITQMNAHQDLQYLASMATKSQNWSMRTTHMSIKRVRQ